MELARSASIPNHYWLLHRAVSQQPPTTTRRQEEYTFWNWKSTAANYNAASDCILIICTSMHYSFPTHVNPSQPFEGYFIILGSSRLTSGTCTELHTRILPSIAFVFAIVKTRRQNMSKPYFQTLRVRRCRLWGLLLLWSSGGHGEVLRSNRRHFTRSTDRDRYKQNILKQVGPARVPF